MRSTELSLALFGIAVGAYCVALLGFVVALAFHRRPIADIGLGAVMLGWIFHLSSIVSRAIEAQHWPLGNMYEYSTGIAFVIVTAYLVFALRTRTRLAGIAVMTVAVALLGVAYML